MMRKIIAMLLVVVLMVVMASPALASRETWDIDYNNEAYTLTVSCDHWEAISNIQTTCRTGSVWTEVRARTDSGVWYHGEGVYGVSSARMILLPPENCYFTRAIGEFDVNDGGYQTSRLVVVAVK